MSQMNSGVRAFKTAASITTPMPAYTRVKQQAAADANGFTGTVLLAGPFDAEVGLTTAATMQAGNHVGVFLKNLSGTRKVVCGSICAIGARLYATTNGQVDTLASPGLGTAGGAIGGLWGVSVEACATAGGVVEAIPVEVMSLDKGAVCLVNTADSPTITNTAAETAFAPAFTFPAATLLPGDVIRVRARLVVTGKNAAETLAIKLYLANALGGTPIYTTGAVNNAANDEIYLDIAITVRTVSATGTVTAMGIAVDGVPGTATAKAVSLGSTTINNLAASVLQLSGTWSAANAANIVLLRDLEIILERQ